MKKILLILLFIVLVFVVILNIKETSLNKEAEMVKEKIKNKTADTIVNEEVPLNLFPEIYNIESIKVDKTLPIISILNLPDTSVTKDSAVSLAIRIKEINKSFDIYLLVNGRKSDMFYKANAGDYNFNNINLQMGENLLEVFYKAGFYKSISSYAVVYRE